MTDLVTMTREPSEDEEYLVFLVNAEGRRASTCALRIQGGDALDAVRLAQDRGLGRFHVVLRREGHDDITVAQAAPLRPGSFAAWDNPCPRKGW